MAITPTQTPYAHPDSGELTAALSLPRIIEAVKRVASLEVMPRYLNVARHRKSDGSVFTQADLAAQDALIHELGLIHPCPFLGEEMGEAEQQALWESGEKGLWCVDPIDGSSNFANGIPYFAISVAFVRSGRPILGVVYDPVADECFSAARGQGSFLNDEPLPIQTGAASLRESIGEVDLKRLPRELASLLGQQPPYASHRNFGASTLEWCYVAAGRFDVYLHGGQKLWDYAAGSLILDEAGGYYCGLYQDDFWSGHPWQRSVIAALRPEVFKDWKSWLQTRLPSK